MIFKTLSNLHQRLISGSLGLFIALLAIFYSYTSVGSIFFTLFIALVVGMSLWEFYRIAQSKETQPLFYIGSLCSFAFLFASTFRSHMGIGKILPEIVVGLSLIAGFVYYFIKGNDPLINLSVTFFGILYLTIPLSCLIIINYLKTDYVNDGRWCLLYLLLVTKVTDMGAFFIGKHFGKHQMSPYISPKKTWEGAIGGSLCAILLSIAFFLLFSFGFEIPPFNLTWSQSIWLALLISIVAQFGDLAESLLKRDVGVKDSSRHLPGLGGFLDIVDSLVFTSVLMYIYLILQSNR